MDDNLKDSGKTWPQYLAVYTALISMFASGIHFGWPSPSIPKILSDEYPHKVDAEEASYITVIGPVGDVIGTILSSLLVDRIGRKPTILSIAFPQILSNLFIYFSSHTKYFLYFARLIGGLSEGACFTVLPIYIGEIAQPQIRGILGISFSIILMSGMMTANVIGTYLDIHTSAVIYLSFPIIFLITFSKMPESPYYYLMTKQTENARNALIFLRHKQNIEPELSKLITDVDRQMSEPGEYADLIRIETNRKATIINAGLRIIQQFSGVSAFTLYSQLLFRQATDVIPEEIAAIVMLALQTILAILSTLLVDRIGRKPLLTASICGCCSALTLEAAYFTLVDYFDYSNTNFRYLPFLGLILFIMSFAIGLGSVVNLIVGELFSASIKSKALGFLTVIFAVTMFASTKFYQFMTDNFSLAIPFTVFAICQILGLIFCVKYVPETKGKTLEEIQQILKNPIKHQVTHM